MTTKFKTGDEHAPEAAPAWVRPDYVGTGSRTVPAMSVGIRLDPATLIQLLDGLKSEAEAEPLSRSAWLRVAESSALGEPDVETTWHLPDGRIVTFDATGPLGATVCIDWFDECAADAGHGGGHSDDDGCRHSTEVCNSPAHLRSILDRLATEVRDG